MTKWIVREKFQDAMPVARWQHHEQEIVQRLIKI
jgi:hypothetical protein